MILEEDDFYLQNDKTFLNEEMGRLKEKLARIKKQKDDEILSLQNQFLLEYGGES